MKRRFMALAFTLTLAACAPGLQGVELARGEAATFSRSTDPAGLPAVALANGNPTALTNARAYLRGGPDFRPDAQLCQRNGLGFSCALGTVEPGKAAFIRYVGAVESGAVRYVRDGKAHVLALPLVPAP